MKFPLNILPTEAIPTSQKPRENLTFSIHFAPVIQRRNVYFPTDQGFSVSALVMVWVGSFSVAGADLWTVGCLV